MRRRAEHAPGLQGKGRKAPGPGPSLPEHSGLDWTSVVGVPGRLQAAATPALRNGSEGSHGLTYP